MKIHRRKIVPVCIWIITGYPAAWVSGSDTRISVETDLEPVVSQLSDYLNTALRSNPAIESAWYNWQQELKQVSAVRGLPDPTIQFGYFLERIETAVGPQEWKLGVMQMIPWPGKLMIQGKIQNGKALSAYHRLQAVTADVLSQVQTVYLDAYYLEKSIEITQKHLNLVKQWEEVILTKYRSASARHADLIKTQIEAIQLEDDLGTLVSGRAPLAGKFRSLLNSDTVRIQFPDSLDGPATLLDREEIHQLVLNNNPALEAKRSMEKVSEQSVTRAKLNWLPDFSLGLDYISTGDRQMNGQPVPESGKDPVVLMGSLSLPLWGFKQSGQVRSARNMALQSETEVENTANTLEAMFETTWASYSDAIRKWHLVSGQLIPKSLESLRATEKAYIGNQTEFLSLVDSQRRHLQFMLSAEKAKIDVYKAIVQLQNLAGRSL
jgi:cobalt-zinc-cadmium efflux system outer membrane protein